ncbi:MAG: chromate transporter [Firmicutes bacterium]|nr:chromate transporter [Bacillota bacterium]
MILWQLFVSFLKIGFFTVGGGYAAIPLFQAELVAGGLLAAEEASKAVADIVAIAGITPGPFAVNFATFTGMRSAGVPGALIASVSVLLPSAVITTTVAASFDRVKNNRLIRDIMYGMRPAVAGLILATAANMAVDRIFGVGNGSFTFDWRTAAICAAVLAALIKTKISPVILILSSGMLGLVLYMFV